MGTHRCSITGRISDIEHLSFHSWGGPGSVNEWTRETLLRVKAENGPATYPKNPTTYLIKRRWPTGGQRHVSHPSFIESVLMGLYLCRVWFHRLVIEKVRNRQKEGREDGERKRDSNIERKRKRERSKEEKREHSRYDMITENLM